MNRDMSVDVRLWSSVLPVPPAPTDDCQARLRAAMPRLVAPQTGDPGDECDRCGDESDLPPDEVERLLAEWAELLRRDAVANE
jgi:hypothetical protein